MKEALVMNRPSPWRVRVPGPLAGCVPGFREYLFTLGYSERSAAGYLQLMAHLSRWLIETGLEPGDFDCPQVERFLRARRAAGRVHRSLTPRGIEPLMDHLRGAGLVPAAESAVVPLKGRDLVISEFVDHLRTERGLAEPTIGNYRGVAVRFLAECGWEPGDPAVLSGAAVNAFVLGEAARRSRGSVNNATIGLRALLRFLRLRGDTPARLVDVVPVAPRWRDAGPGRAIDPARVSAMLAACDRTTGIGRRDYAILKLLARMGLRRGEVAALSVDDVNWRVGELTVTGKGNRREVLPLPVDVGEALADYCRHGRRNGGARALFTASLAPWGGLSPSAVSMVVVRACERAGLPVVGPHRLRHTAATEMRAAGAPLLEIGQVLRHLDTATTAIYARDDLNALRAVARPWPGSRP